MKIILTGAEQKQFEGAYTQTIKRRLSEMIDIAEILDIHRDFPASETIYHIGIEEPEQSDKELAGFPGRVPDEEMPVQGDYGELTSESIQRVTWQDSLAISKDEFTHNIHPGRIVPAADFRKCEGLFTMCSASEGQRCDFVESEGANGKPCIYLNELEGNRYCWLGKGE